MAAVPWVLISCGPSSSSGTTRKPPSSFSRPAPMTMAPIRLSITPMTSGPNCCKVSWLRAAPSCIAAMTTPIGAGAATPLMLTAIPPPPTPIMWIGAGVASVTVTLPWMPSTMADIPSALSSRWLWASSHLPQLPRCVSHHCSWTWRPMLTRALLPHSTSRDCYLLMAWRWRSMMRMGSLRWMLTTSAWTMPSTG